MLSYRHYFLLSFDSSLEQIKSATIQKTWRVTRPLFSNSELQLNAEKENETTLQIQNNESQVFKSCCKYYQISVPFQSSFWVITINIWGKFWEASFRKMGRKIPWLCQMCLNTIYSWQSVPFLLSQGYFTFPFLLSSLLVLVLYTKLHGNSHNAPLIHYSILNTQHRRQRRKDKRREELNRRDERKQTGWGKPELQLAVG